MYTVTVSDHMMIAHSLRGEVFGPSQRLHGATYVVQAAFSGETLDGDGILLDIAGAGRELRSVLDTWDRHNLDEDPSLAGRNTTTEVLAREIADRLAERIAAGSTGSPAALTELTVTLHESPVAWASYHRTLGAP